MTFAIRNSHWGRQLQTRFAACVILLTVAGGCAGAPGIAEPTKDAKLVQGPPVSDIVTPFDDALSCLKGAVQPSITFSVGAILDQTGKEQLSDGGNGKFVTQGAGDIVQSALFRAGTTVLNRRDPRIMETEVKWGIRDGSQIVSTNFFITGSINSLDFIPGSGFNVDVAGVGAQYRQHRILVGLDLSMTEASTGRVVANVPLQKQIFASEAGVGATRFFGNTLVLADIGGREREALHFALRQMLNLATFELLTQVMHPKNYKKCREQIDRMHGFVDNTNTAAAVERWEAEGNGKVLVAAQVNQPRPAGPAAARKASAMAPSAEAENESSSAQYWEDEAPQDADALRREAIREGQRRRDLKNR
jgi:curli biogenesis system outer membrane secretion channel CsgG